MIAKQRKYRSPDKEYDKAMKEAKRRKEELATILRQVVKLYGEGVTLTYIDDNKNKGVISEK